MDTLLSYSLSDFILFTETTYYRQFEFYNQATWPVHIIAIVFIAFIIYVLWKKPAGGGRVVAGLLVISWLWVAIAFLYMRFYQVHVVANWYAYGFILQAALLAWYVIVYKRFNNLFLSRPGSYTGLVLLLIGIVIYPFTGLISGRPWQQLEMFGLAPDPTVLATLGVLLLYKAPKILYVVPVLWLMISGVTLSVM